MSISQVLEVALGLIVVYYILGSIISLVTQLVNEFFETRGKTLERYLVKIVGDKKIGDFISLPQMQALRPIRYKNWFSVFGAVTEPKKIEKIPVATLVDSFFDFAGLTANQELNLLQLAELVDKLPDSEGKRAFISWINQGVTSIGDLRTRTTAYFTGLMDQAAATFRANARSLVIVMSIGVTILFGTDSIQLAKTLWTNAELRALAVAKAEMVVAQEGADASMDDLIQELSDLTIKIGWWQTEHPEAGASAMDWVLFVIQKVLGLGLTAVAVSQGSSFWYDLLKKLASPTSSSSKTNESGSSSSGGLG
ncbi:hypothetical protein ANAEL_05918 [Anaerolineales bacterium]|nr:hypothetical protein ANAEL_05918 [Anaerolineales bacterium]